MDNQIFIAATGQHKGKTTSTLGVVATLKSQGYNVGYCKPVGQQHLSVKGDIADKDAVLFGDAIGFEVEPKIHSPVVMPSGFTAEFLDHPQKYDLESMILEAQKELLSRHEIVVYEGTGHPGVGSIAGVSNARVASLLNTSVVLVVEGGIGRTIDELALSLALFEKESVEIKGIIVNKVHADKIERVTHYVKKALDKLGIPLLGVIPYDSILSFPLMQTISDALKGKTLQHEEKMDNRVEELVAGSLIEVDEFTLFQNLLLVVNYGRFHQAVDKIQQEAKGRELDEPPLSGVVVTGDGRGGRRFSPADAHHPYLIKHQVPVISTPYDTYDAVVKISKIEVKINSNTPWKVRRAIEMVHDNIDFDLLMGRK